MARVFANDVLRACEKQGIDSKFETVILAAHRARRIPKLNQSDHVLSGEEYDQGSTAVTALREIESGKIDMIELRDQVIQSLRNVTAVEEPHDE
jgi:DNA-directed RNA polymerase omega subunit